MKKTYKIFIVFYYLFFNLISFAQIGSGPGDESNNGSSSLEGGDPVVVIIGSGPGDENNNGSSSLEGGDAQAASINSELGILILLGFVYSFYLLGRNRQIKKLS